MRSFDTSDVQLGFEQADNNELLYRKKVSLNELENVYEIIPFAFVSGYRFAVEAFNEATGVISLVTNNSFVQDKLEVKPHGKFEYIIELPIEDVELKEDRIPILGFDEK